MTKYFLYARKSTDVEDKQVRSIDDQLAVLRALAKAEGLNIAEEFIEKQSAKVPGRLVFGEMLTRIERASRDCSVRLKKYEAKDFLERGFLEGRSSDTLRYNTCPTPPVRVL
ncbi:MAG: recombinase family protein [Candidatus Azambacteria bacterium]|nr:recombinase family protein [Candidatus Azambacteria bacterium]